jgi:molybdopterin-guanine dinucleotide biosynthesis protein A
MGAPKATLDLGGRPLVLHPLAAFTAAGLEAVVVAKERTELPPLAVPVWREPDEPSHPLAGIVAALARAGRPLVVCACDMPFVTPSLLSLLARREERLVLPRAGGRLHPLLARYDPALLQRLKAGLREPRALRDIVSELDPALLQERELCRLGDPERLLFNVNTPGDLERARELLRG